MYMYIVLSHSQHRSGIYVVLMKGLFCFFNKSVNKLWNASKQATYLLIVVTSSHIW